ncbi:52 kDa repressor of the inhibitor of the protein kinase-like [Amphiura filiformis]|uniref:52 kDa repressor of the inhibitor of the protein kinase-like n=1 Tax=Amphiura filiformis TaxID=82378 RepID=UPI003B22458E
MSSARIGVQELIRKESPLAVYIHCSGHCLNLVIAHSCKLQPVRNMIDKLKAVCLFFENSPKRNGMLEAIYNKFIPDKKKRKPLLDLCKTRWAERDEAYQHFYQSYQFIVRALECIALGVQSDDYGEDFRDVTWSASSKSDANSLLHSVTSVEFIVIFITVYQILSHLDGITKKLQKTTLDILEAYTRINKVKSVYNKLRENVEEEFGKIFRQATNMAESVNVTITMPRRCINQRHRPTVEALSPEQWYLRNTTIPFLDHIISELDAQFSGLSQTSTRLLGLVPSVACGEFPVDITEAAKQYEEDLPSPELLEQELTRWRLEFADQSEEERPSSCAQAIHKCDKDEFPNIFTLLQIACTLPVTSCECERNASTLRRLNTWMRASMAEERLASLALIHIHYSATVSLDEV